MWCIVWCIVWWQEWAAARGGHAKREGWALQMAVGCMPGERGGNGWREGSALQAGGWIC